MLPAQTAKLLNPEAFSGHQRFSLAGNLVAQRRHIFSFVILLKVPNYQKIERFTGKTVQNN